MATYQAHRKDGRSTASVGVGGSRPSGSSHRRPPLRRHATSSSSLSSSSTPISASPVTNSHVTTIADGENVGSSRSLMHPPPTMDHSPMVVPSHHHPPPPPPPPSYTHSRPFPTPQNGELEGGGRHHHHEHRSRPSSSNSSSNTSNSASDRLHPLHLSPSTSASPFSTSPTPSRPRHHRLSVPSHLPPTQGMVGYHHSGGIGGREQEAASTLLPPTSGSSFGVLTPSGRGGGGRGGGGGGGRRRRRGGECAILPTPLPLPSRPHLSSPFGLAALPSVSSPPSSLPSPLSASLAVSSSHPITVDEVVEERSLFLTTRFTPSCATPISLGSSPVLANGGGGRPSLLGRPPMENTSPRSPTTTTTTSSGTPLSLWCPFTSSLMPLPAHGSTRVEGMPEANRGGTTSFSFPTSSSSSTSSPSPPVLASPSPVHPRSSFGRPGGVPEKEGEDRRTSVLKSGESSASRGSPAPYASPYRSPSTLQDTGVPSSSSPSRLSCSPRPPRGKEQRHLEAPSPLPTQEMPVHRKGSAVGPHTVCSAPPFHSPTRSMAIQEKRYSPPLFSSPHRHALQTPSDASGDPLRDERPTRGVSPTARIGRKDDSDAKRSRPQRHVEKNEVDRTPRREGSAHTQGEEKEDVPKDKDEEKKEKEKEEPLSPQRGQVTDPVMASLVSQWFPRVATVPSGESLPSILEQLRLHERQNIVPSSPSRPPLFPLSLLSSSSLAGILPLPPPSSTPFSTTNTASLSRVPSPAPPAVLEEDTSSTCRPVLSHGSTAPSIDDPHPSLLSPPALLAVTPLEASRLTHQHPTTVVEDQSTPSHVEDGNPNEGGPMDAPPLIEVAPVKTKDTPLSSSSPSTVVLSPTPTEEKEAGGWRTLARTMTVDAKETRGETTTSTAWQHPPSLPLSPPGIPMSLLMSSPSSTSLSTASSSPLSPPSPSVSVVTVTPKKGASTSSTIPRPCIPSSAVVGLSFPSTASLHASSEATRRPPSFPSVSFSSDEKKEGHAGRHAMVLPPSPHTTSRTSPTIAGKEGGRDGSSPSSTPKKEEVKKGDLARGPTPRAVVLHSEEGVQQRLPRAPSIPLLLPSSSSTSPSLPSAIASSPPPISSATSPLPPPRGTPTVLRTSSFNSSRSAALAEGGLHTWSGSYSSSNPNTTMNGTNGGGGGGAGHLHRHGSGLMMPLDALRSSSTELSFVSCSSVDVHELLTDFRQAAMECRRASTARHHQHPWHSPTSFFHVPFDKEAEKNMMDAAGKSFFNVSMEIKGLLSCYPPPAHTSTTTSTTTTTPSRSPLADETLSTGGGASDFFSTFSAMPAMAAAIPAAGVAPAAAAVGDVSSFAVGNDEEEREAAEARHACSLINLDDLSAILDRVNVPLPDMALLADLFEELRLPRKGQPMLFEWHPHGSTKLTSTAVCTTATSPSASATLPTAGDLSSPTRFPPPLSATTSSSPPSRSSSSSSSLARHDDDGHDHHRSTTVVHAATAVEIERGAAAAAAAAATTTAGGREGEKKKKSIKKDERNDLLAQDNSAAAAPLPPPSLSVSFSSSSGWRLEGGRGSRFGPSFSASSSAKGGRETGKGVLSSAVGVASGTGSMGEGSTRRSPSRPTKEENSSTTAPSCALDGRQCTREHSQERSTGGTEGEEEKKKKKKKAEKSHPHRGRTKKSEKTVTGVPTIDEVMGVVVLDGEKKGTIPSRCSHDGSSTTTSESTKDGEGDGNSFLSSSASLSISSLSVKIAPPPGVKDVDEGRSSADQWVPISCKKHPHRPHHFHPPSSLLSLKERKESSLHDVSHRWSGTSSGTVTFASSRHVLDDDVSRSVSRVGLEGIEGKKKHRKKKYERESVEESSKGEGNNMLDHEEEEEEDWMELETFLARMAFMVQGSYPQGVIRSVFFAMVEAIDQGRCGVCVWRKSSASLHPLLRASSTTSAGKHRKSSVCMGHHCHVADLSLGGPSTSSPNTTTHTTHYLTPSMTRTISWQECMLAVLPVWFGGRLSSSAATLLQPTYPAGPPSASCAAVATGMPPLGSTASSSHLGSTTDGCGESATVFFSSTTSSVPHPPSSSSTHMPPPIAALSPTVSGSCSGAPSGGSFHSSPSSDHHTMPPHPSPEPTSNFSPSTTTLPPTSATTANAGGFLPPSPGPFTASPFLSASTPEEMPATDFVHISRTVPLYICVMDGIFRRLGLRKITGAHVQQALRLAHLPDEDPFWECHVNDFAILVQALVHVVQQQPLTSSHLSGALLSGSIPLWGGTSSWHLGSTTSSSIAGVTGGGGVRVSSSESSVTIHGSKRVSGASLTSPFIGVS